MNWLVVFSADALLVWLAGPMALLYLGLSFLFSIGFHPLGARWIQEHYLVSPDQETYSYYGPLNLLAFNVGYHNEHHDFASIPWNRLPALKQMAPEYYDTLISHRSWTKLWLQFMFDRRLSHFSRRSCGRTKWTPERAIGRYTPCPRSTAARVTQVRRQTPPPSRWSNQRSAPERAARMGAKQRYGWR